MTDAWHTYQAWVAALQQPIPVPIWCPGPRVSYARCGQAPGASDEHHQPVTQVVRLPGIHRPEGGPLMARLR